MVAVAPSEPPLDGVSFLQELLLLCGAPIVVCVVLAIVVRVSGPSATVDLLGTLAITAIALCAAIAHRRVLAGAFRFPTARDWGVTLLVGALVGPCLVMAFWVLERAGFPVATDYVTGYVRDGWPPWVAAADIALFTPIFEELLFRGTIQGKLSQALSPTEALIVQAALFSALHLSPLILLTHFVMGLAFGWVRRRSRSLYPGMLLHAAWNGWVVWSSSG